jgi:hypothetical protein
VLDKGSQNSEKDCRFALVPHATTVVVSHMFYSAMNTIWIMYDQQLSGIILPLKKEGRLKAGKEGWYTVYHMRRAAR